MLTTVVARATAIAGALAGLATRAAVRLRRAPLVGGPFTRVQGVRAEDVGGRLARGLGGVLARPRRLLACVVLVLALAGLAVAQLTPEAPPSLLAGPGSEAATATRSVERNFGGEPIVVLLKGDIDTVLSATNLAALRDLEGRLSKLDGVQTVFGPGTFVGQTIDQIKSVLSRELGDVGRQADQAGQQAADAARSAGRSERQQTAAREQARSQALGPLQAQYQQLFLRFGYLGLPNLDNKQFTSALVLGPRSTPKPRFSWIFADRTHSLIAVRPRAGLSDRELRALSVQVRRLTDQTRLPGLQTSVAGAPLVVAGLTHELSRELPRLVPVALIAMIIALLIGLGVRWRSLATLVPAALAVLLTAALGWVLGLGLTPATIAALPVILGLTIDYAVQLQVRYRSHRSSGAAPEQAARLAATHVGPVLLLAAGVMLVGFLMLTVSSVPLVDRLGLTLAIGVICGLTSALVLTGPLLVLRDRSSGDPPELRLPDVRIPARVRTGLLAAAVVLPLAGLALTSQSTVESDIQKLAPRDMPALKDVERLQSELGISGQLRVSVRGRDVTDPKVLNWMRTFQSRALAKEPRLQPGPNLAAILASGSGGSIRRRDVARLLRLVPPYFVSAALNKSRTQAEVSFGMPLLDAEQQGDIIDGLKPLIATAPAGTTVQVGGLVALSASSVSSLESSRPWLLLAAAFAIFLLLLGVRRRLDRAVVPLVPALLTAGVSSLFTAVTGMSLSPLSAGLEPLVLAVGVEFGLLLEARYHEARSSGQPEDEAARTAARTVGAPVAVAAVTVAAGFAVLGASRLGVLQQFGLLAAGELLFCAASAILLVPFLAATWGRHRSADAPATPADPAWTAPPRVASEPVGGGRV